MTQTKTLNHEIFADLSPEDRQTILDFARLRRLRRGEMLVRQGEAADTVYYVLRGKFDVLRDGRHLVAEIMAGEPVGEIAFFGGLPRTADVQASRDSDVLELSQQAYAALSARLPAFTQAVLRSLGRRLAAATVSAPELQPRVADAVGLCAAGPHPVPPELVRDLAAALQAQGRPVVTLTAADFPAGLDAHDDDQLSDWFAARERDGGRLLVVTGCGNPDWDRAALRQCDQLLLVGRAEDARHGPPRASPLESYVLPLFRPRQVSLILWRDQAAQPIRDTRHWLSSRQVHLHHHVALDRPADLERVSRFLTGRALGAVFGGGGALGTGHIGALRALATAGVRFDMFGGTSIGSSVALACARDDSAARMLEDFEHFFLRDRALGKMNLPLYSVFDHHHLDRRLQQMHGDQRLEDLPLNAYTVAANLSTHELYVHRSGPCWQGLRTSASIPAALPPYITERGEVLVDGGIMDNVPIGVMRGLKSGPNLIFMLSPGADWRVGSRYDGLPSRWRLAWRLLTRRHEGSDFPKVGEIVARSMQVTSKRSFRGAGIGGDLLLEPPAVPGMGLFSWRLGRAQEQAAYDYTMRRIDAMGGPEALLRWQSGAA